MIISRIFRIPIWSRVAHRWIVELPFKIEMYWIEQIIKNETSCHYSRKASHIFQTWTPSFQRRFGWSWWCPSSPGFAPSGRAQHVLETDARLWYARSIGGMATTCQRPCFSANISKNLRLPLNVHPLEVNFFGNLRKPFCLFGQKFF